MLTELHEIIVKVKKGDQEAFRSIVNEYRQQSFSMAFRILCDEEEARDIVQECFIKIWLKIGTYDMKQNFSAWLNKIVANSAIDRMRQIRRHPKVSLEKVNEHIEQLNMDSIQKETENQETARFISRIAEGLPEKQRMVFVLRDLQGIESQEVMQILDMSETSVKSNLYHARKTVRENLIKAKLV